MCRLLFSSCLLLVYVSTAVRGETDLQRLEPYGPNVLCRNGDICDDKECLGGSVRRDMFGCPLPGCPCETKGKFTPPDLSCQCIRAPCDCPQCRPLPSCPVNCELFGGWVVGKDGCNTCQCKDRRPKCPRRKCRRRTCGALGYKKNSRGCDTCRCNDSPITTERCLAAPLCKRLCQYGFAKDARGCFLPCTCNPAPPPTTERCLDGPLCRKACPYGFATDERGCFLPCTCNPPPTPRWGEWSPWSACSNRCGSGFRTRTRTCSDPSGDGELCLGSDRERERCSSRRGCPVDGGRCPILPPGTIGTCVEACGLDGGCPSGQLCCSNGCGHTCQDAVFDEGRCPTIPDGTFGICIEACGPNTCPSGQLCCSNGCGHTCQDAVFDKPRVKPGICPALRAAPEGLQLSCRGDDFRCPGNEKCCSVRPGTYVCIDPIFPDPPFSLY